MTKRDVKLTLLATTLIALSAALSSCGDDNDSSPNQPNPGNPGTTPASVTVRIPMNAMNLGNRAFGEPIDVPAGTTVTWINDDSMPHTVTSTEGAFDSDTLNHGESFSFTFTTPGEYDYFCEIHPTMTGRVNVLAGGASPSPSPSPSDSPSPGPSPSDSPSPGPTSSPYVH
jgi:plastocyanin